MGVILPTHRVAISLRGGGRGFRLPRFAPTLINVLCSGPLLALGRPSAVAIDFVGPSRMLVPPVSRRGSACGRRYNRGRRVGDGTTGVRRVGIHRRRDGIILRMGHRLPITIRNAFRVCLAIVRSLHITRGIKIGMIIAFRRWRIRYGRR